MLFVKILWTWFWIAIFFLGMLNRAQVLLGFVVFAIGGRFCLVEGESKRRVGRINEF